MATIVFPQDNTGISPLNLVTREPHVLSEFNSDSKRTLILKHSPFYQDNFKLEHRDVNGVYSPMVLGIDYHFAYPYMGASVALGKKLFGGVQIIRTLTSGMVYVTYQTLGGGWGGDRDSVMEQIASSVYNPRIGTWDNLIALSVPQTFPPLGHEQDLENFKGLEDLVNSMNNIGQRISQMPTPGLLPQTQILELMTLVEKLRKRLDVAEEDIRLLKSQNQRFG